MSDNSAGAISSGFVSDSQSLRIMADSQNKQTKLRMTERTKRPKSKVTWSDVKEQSSLTSTGRVYNNWFANLYVFHKDNQTFLHARFGLGENPLEAYKATHPGS